MLTFSILTGFALSIFGQVADLNASNSASKKVWAEMVGQWRVSGQPKRGSSSGAWTTQSRIFWSEKSEVRGPDDRSNHRTLIWNLTSGPKSGTLKFVPDSISGEFSRMTFKPVQGDERIFSRSSTGITDHMVFESPASGKFDAERWSFQQRSRDRWVILVESRKNQSSNWSRIVEMGMTRDGTTIAIGDGQKKCVVTGGQGDMEVKISGKSYFVCCSGCRDALLEDPEAFIKGLNQSETKQIPSQAVNP